MNLLDELVIFLRALGHTSGHTQRELWADQGPPPPPAYNRVWELLRASPSERTPGSLARWQAREARNAGSPARFLLACELDSGLTGLRLGILASLLACAWVIEAH